MREQSSGLVKRTRAPQPASRAYAGHEAGIHPEEDDDLEEEEAYYVTRPHSSARRYDLAPEQVIRQGNKTYHVHHGSPPVPPRRHSYVAEEELEEQRPRRVHWFVYLGIFFMAVVAFSFALISVGNWWTGVQEDWQFGKYPRTFQIDAVVGHGDSQTSPTHFIALNLDGQIVVLEVSRNDPTKARRYDITTIQNNEGNPPVRLSFQDVNADGRPDMLVQIGDPSSGTAFTIILLNDGTQFVSKLIK